VSLQQKRVKSVRQLRIEPATSAKGSKRLQKRRGTQKRSKPLRAGKAYAVTGLSVVVEREITQGVRHLTYHTNGAKPIVVHAVRIDRTASANAVRIAKAHNRFDALERLVDLSNSYASEHATRVLAAVNANFWRAGRSTPIGPCIVDGEIVEMLTHKNWSSGLYDVEDRLTIDTFKLRGTVTFGNIAFDVSSVNRRVDSGVVVFNRFCGGKVPTVFTSDIDRQITELMRDTLFMNGDSTEQELTREQLRKEFTKAQQESNREYGTWKVRLRYMRSPAINLDVPCEVIDVDTGSVDIPLRGCVVSIPRSEIARLPKSGERCTLRFSTNTHVTARFMNAVSGTPRLVRDGRLGHEAAAEGATSSRFIQHALARTAIGTDRSGNEHIFVAIPPGSATTVGANLDQLSAIMKLLGCHHAMNLDGGGSSGLVVEGDHVFFEGEDPLTRRISVALTVVRRTHVLRSAIGGTAPP
jgi:exopolysaccharide biosynthesis protein